MFDIGFLELVVVGVVSLVVLGPERLPGAIRTVSLWIGRLRRSFNNIKLDIEKEIGADEIRRQLRNEAIMDKFKHTKTQVTDTLNTVKKETEAFRKNVELESQTAGLSSQDNKATAEKTPVRTPIADELAAASRSDATAHTTTAPSSPAEGTAAEASGAKSTTVTSNEAGSAAGGGAAESTSVKSTAATNKAAKGSANKSSTASSTVSRSTASNTSSTKPVAAKTSATKKGAAGKAAAAKTPTAGITADKSATAAGSHAGHSATSTDTQKVES